MGQKPLDEVMIEIDEFELQLRKNEKKRPTRNNPGKDKCDRLRLIRKTIAAVNDIEYTPSECNHSGPCKGTCPVCDMEIQYLSEQLQNKKDHGEEVFLNGVAVQDFHGEEFDSEEDEHEFADMGMDEWSEENFEEFEKELMRADNESDSDEDEPPAMGRVGRFIKRI